MNENFYGLYIHVPFCLSKCDYCAFYSIKPDAQLIEAYLNRLEKEARLRLSDFRTKFSTVFVGGGNPSALGIEGLKRLIEIIWQYVDPGIIAEWTFETNPETLTAEISALLSDLPGIRLSIGIQRLKEKELKILGRRAGIDSIYAAIETALANIKNVGADFILGVPGCSEIVADVEQLLARFPLQHISAYFLTIEENTPLFQSVESGLIACPDEVGPEELFSLRKLLGSKGFEHYEISNYALPGRRCLHNMNYWRPADYFGLGPSAVSTINGVRMTNSNSLHRWLNSEGPALEKLSEIDIRNEYSMLRLRLLNDGLDLSLLEERFGSQPADFWEELARRIAAGELCRTGATVRLTDAGLIIADDVMASLFI